MALLQVTGKASPWGSSELGFSPVLGSSFRCVGFINRLHVVAPGISRLMSPRCSKLQEGKKTHAPSQWSTPKPYCIH